MICQTSYKFRAYPNQEQRDQFFQDYGSARYVWNFIRRICKDAYKTTAEFDENKKYIKGTAKIPSTNERSKLLTELRNNPDLPFMKKGMCVAQQQVLRDFNAALNNFFRNPKEIGYPVYKNENDKRSVRYTDSKKSIELNHIYVAGQGWVKIKNSYFKELIKNGQEIPVIIPKMVTMECDKSGRFWISV
jgi:putative transposase